MALPRTASASPAPGRFLLGSLVSLELPLSPVGIFAIGIEHPLDMTVFVATVMMRNVTSFLGIVRFPPLPTVSRSPVTVQRIIERAPSNLVTSAENWAAVERCAVPVIRGLPSTL